MICYISRLSVTQYFKYCLLPDVVCLYQGGDEAKMMFCYTETGGYISNGGLISRRVGWGNLRYVVKSQSQLAEYVI